MKGECVCLRDCLEDDGDSGRVVARPCLLQVTKRWELPTVLLPARPPWKEARGALMGFLVCRGRLPGCLFIKPARRHQPLKQRSGSKKKMAHTSGEHIKLTREKPSYMHSS